MWLPGTAAAKSLALEQLQHNYEKVVSNSVQDALDSMHLDSMHVIAAT
jgi:hypothetical protein